MATKEVYDLVYLVYDLVYDLSSAMSKFFACEDDRMSKFREVMNEHGYDLKGSTVEGTTYRTDGDGWVGKLCFMLVEGKFEIASTGVEPLFQAGRYYLEFFRVKAQSGR